MPEKYHFMDKEGLKTFTEEFFKKVDKLLDDRIVTTIDETSTDDQIVSAEALANIINGEGE